jgi:hypothetical protein
MTNDTFTRVCLAIIVVLVGFMTYENNVHVVKAATPGEYMIEGNSGQDATRVNAHMKVRVSEGWTLHTFGTSYLVWQK